MDNIGALVQFLVSPADYDGDELSIECLRCKAWKTFPARNKPYGVNLQLLYEWAVNHACEASENGEK